MCPHLPSEFLHSPPLVIPLQYNSLTPFRKINSPLNGRFIMTRFSTQIPLSLCAPTVLLHVPWFTRFQTRIKNCSRAKSLPGKCNISPSPQDDSPSPQHDSPSTEPEPTVNRRNGTPQVDTPVEIVEPPIAERPCNKHNGSLVCITRVCVAPSALNRAEDIDALLDAIKCDQ